MRAMRGSVRCWAPLAGALLAATALVGCTGSDRSGSLLGKRTTTLVVQQEAPILDPVDVDPPGPSVGDRLEFSARIAAGGQLAGTLTGVLTVTKLGKADQSGNVDEERAGVLTFDFGSSGSIEVRGDSKYKPERQEMEVQVPQVRKVVGGTGRYAGASGRVTTVRNADGTYTHTFALEGDLASTVPRSNTGSPG